VDAVFINPLPGGCGLNEATVEPPLGIAYLAAMLQQHGHCAALVDANALGLDSEGVVRAIGASPRLIGISVNSFTYQSALDLARLCRKAFPDALLVLGGPLASAAPEVLLEEFPCHGIIRGEGEFTVLRLVENMTKGAPAFDGEVPGAMFRDPSTGAVTANPIVRITDLDGLPFPAYHLLPPLRTYKSRARKRPMAAIVTSRGCPHQCTFCSKDVFLRKVTFRSPGNVLAEIDQLVERYGVRQIDILDDNFTQSRARVEEIMDGLIARGHRLALNLQSGIRTEIIDEPLLAKMKRAGVYKLAFGIESADPAVLALCRKSLDLTRAEEAARAAKRMGFLVYGFFVIGLPGETEEGFKKTLDFARKIDFDVANFCMAIPFPGTELYRTVEREGTFLIDTTRNIDEGFYSGRVFFTLDGMVERDVLRRYHAAYREFYSLPRKLKLLTKIRSWPELCWHFDAASFVLRGMLRSKSRS
jgi:radical SAM superfamily enzyme YgiQ (UPF0313 family)